VTDIAFHSFAMKFGTH